MRTVVAFSIAIVLAVGLTSPVFAGKPIRGCPNESFIPMLSSEFRDLSRELGVPEELLGASFLAAWQALDKNGDDLACVKDVPDTKGHLGSWVFNAIDNTANR